MKLGEDIFLRMTADFYKLKEYGFKQKGSNYFFSKNFMQNEFKAEIKVNSKGKLTGKVIELENNEEYLPIHIESYIGAFVGKIRDAYLSILKEIAKKCFKEKEFISEQANRISEKIFNQFGEKSDNPFSKADHIAVYRHSMNQKWYALVMNIKESLLTKGIKEEDSPNIEILNIKIDSSKYDDIHKLKGVFPAYHMNHTQWVSIMLNDSLKDEQIMELIEVSRNYAMRSSKSPNGELVKSVWILPANPSSFDIESAFNKYKEIDWKQSSKVKVGDIAYMYVGAPVSAILYKCEITATDIPYDYSDKNITITHLMKIKQLHKYEKNFCTFKKLNELGINAVRGPRLANNKFIEFIEDTKTDL